MTDNLVLLGISYSAPTHSTALHGADPIRTTERKVEQSIAHVKRPVKRSKVPYIDAEKYKTGIDSVVGRAAVVQAGDIMVSEGPIATTSGYTSDNVIMVAMWKHEGFAKTEKLLTDSGSFKDLRFNSPMRRIGDKIDDLAYHPIVWNTIKEALTATDTISHYKVLVEKLTKAKLSYPTDRVFTSWIQKVRTYQLQYDTDPQALGSHEVELSNA
ncbi:hypothetical protein SARC_10256 [Sphaeroforma arctica JP610]|uniref:Uncharacterized protein n=1 Tax=Sphaeroforma arctica JP610 TaxID=667725 RepID=A0A0L0FML9_9EUKA|nr:hypothetical protein SARC_10256 [Sphaeroforma arctica JP610]KNC77278.1 hypothetical protein SARC_10256 [Sphaeroforma arctica JP610]|eukprot:XP_014151180.1 hypothetical protein SARC_10256 [Sphaeroforma arctica JP610]